MEYMRKSNQYQPKDGRDRREQGSDGMIATIGVSAAGAPGPCGADKGGGDKDE